MDTKLTFLPMDDKVQDKAVKMAARLGFRDGWAYQTSSDLPGLTLVPTRITQKGGTICNTVEFGLVFIQTAEDLNLKHLE